MRCCVRSCINNSKKTAKTHGITFYPFPQDPKQCAAWTTALRLEQWERKERSVVCSDHFDLDDFYLTKCGVRKVKSNAVPVLDQESELDMDSPAVNTCRVCLASNTRMCDILDKDLGPIYEHLTGTCLTDNDRLPQKLCWECAHRMRAGWRLRDKALRSHHILMGVLMTGHCITLRDIKSVDRIQNKLNSTLISRVWNQIDFTIRLTDNGEFVKTESGDSGCNDSNCHDSACHDSGEKLKEEDGTISMDIPQTPNLPLTDVEIKEECSDSEIFVEELPDHFESEDDIKLSEVVSAKLQLKKPKKRPKKVKLKKLEPEDIIKERRREKMPRKREAKCEEEEDPATATEKYKNSDVKRRRTQDALDESLFNITSLTYEEQIAEVEQRQESTAYKNAPFKCTVCYRGFVIMDRYVAHSVRHTDACGAYECFICKTRLKSSRALRKHLTAQHTEKFSCKGCPFITRNRGVAREHEKWHAGTKYKCPHCPSEFDKITTYMGHIRIKHASDFVCNLCGYTFVSRKGVDVHKKKKHRLAECGAPLEGPFCEVCDVRFINEEAHDRHLKLSSRHSHENDPNRIRNDSQSMNSNGRITRKVERRPSIHPRDASDKDRRSQPAGPVTCEQCGIQLRDLRLYAQHFRRAHPDKNRTKYPAMKTPAMCEQCGRIFQSMALLKDHMWVHTGEKRFKCDRCDKSFTQKTNLMFHARAHSSARPSYECPLCGKLFAFHNNRRRHMFIHTGLKPFKCETCGKCFTTAGEQRAHVEHVHMKKPWPKRSRGRGVVSHSTVPAWGTMED